MAPLFHLVKKMCDTTGDTAMPHLYEGEPDARQSNETSLDDDIINRFRPTYRQLTDDEKRIHDWLKSSVLPFAMIANEIVQDQYRYESLKSLELFIMWAVKGLTGSGLREIGVALDIIEHNSAEISEDDIEYIAMEAHKVDRIFCNGSSERLPEWENLTGSQRASRLDNVQLIIDNRNITDSEIHNNWVSYELSMGWKQGFLHDERLKLDPDLMDYEELSPDKKVRITLFKQTVLGLLNYKSV